MSSKRFYNINLKLLFLYFSHLIREHCHADPFHRFGLVIAKHILREHKQGGVSMVGTEERILSIEELLSNIRSSKEIMKKHGNKERSQKNRTVNNLKHMSNNLPVGMIILVALIAAVGIMVIMLKAEVADFRNLREQISSNDSKFKITIIEEKLEVSEKEKRAIKSDLAHIKKALEELRNPKTERKSLARR
jgi:hypothetical protein